MTHKMILAIVPHDQVECVLKALITTGYTATYCESRGGVLRQRQQMLFIAVAETDVERVLIIIRENCRGEMPVDSQTSDETLFPTATPMLTRTSGGGRFCLGS